MRIRELRLAAGMTLQELASIMGVKYPSVQAWETGKTSPTANKLPKLAAVLGCEINDLYGEEQRP